MLNRTLILATKRAHAGIVALGIPIAIALLASPASAQFSSTDTQTDPDEWTYQAYADYGMQFETKLDRGDHFDYWEVEMGARGQGPVGRNVIVGALGSYNYRDYSWDVSQNNSLPDYGNNNLEKEPWGGVHTVDVMPSSSFVIGRGFSIDASVPIRYSAETGATKNGMSAGIIGGIGYQYNENLKISLGVGLMSMLEDSAELFPVLSFDFRVTDQIRIATSGKPAVGGDFSVIWEPTKILELRMSAGYERERFRLDEHGNAQDKNGVGQLKQVPVDFGVRLILFEGAALDIEGGVAFGGRLRVEDSDGNKLYSQDYDPAGRLRARITIPF